MAGRDRVWKSRSEVELPERLIRPGGFVIESGIARLRADAREAHVVRTGRILRNTDGQRRAGRTNRVTFFLGGTFP